MFRLTTVITSILLISLILTGCEPAQPTPIPTATPAPPTATSVPPVPLTATRTLPTATAVPPTAAPTALPPLSGSGGGVIAFSSNRDGDYDIYVMDVPGGTDAAGAEPNWRQLTNDPGTEGYAALSPDGRKIAFYAYTDRTIWSIYVMDANGDNRQRLTNRKGCMDSAPAWSPDGAQIAFASQQGDDFEIWTMNADGSSQRKLEGVSGGGPKWSPDGTKIVFHTEGRDDSEIVVMDVDGTNQRPLTANDAQDWWPDWSPDGSQIVFMSDRDGNWEIYAMDADGVNQRRLTDDGAEDRKPAWSPDGAQIVYTSDRDGDMEIFVMKADGANQRQLTRNSTREIQPAWWPADN